MDFKHRKLPEYYGHMIVCCGKARPISSLKHGRELIGKLTQTKIKSSNMRKNNQTSKNLYSERDIVVPAFICNPDTKEENMDRSVDWTFSNSPITEIKCAPFERWWPRSIFKCSQKIPYIAEEVTVETDLYIVHFEVSYVYTKEHYALFDDLPDSENVGIDKPEVELPEDNGQKLIGFQTPEGKGMPMKKEGYSNCLPTDEELERAKEEYESKKVKPTVDSPYITEGYNPAPPQKKSHTALKVLLGIGGLALLGAGLYFGLRFFMNRKE
jgi:hypothetical protein